MRCARVLTTPRSSSESDVGNSSLAWMGISLSFSSVFFVNSVRFTTKMLPESPPLSTFRPSCGISMTGCKLYCAILGSWLPPSPGRNFSISRTSINAGEGNDQMPSVSATCWTMSLRFNGFSRRSASSAVHSQSRPNKKDWPSSSAVILARTRFVNSSSCCFMACFSCRSSSHESSALLPFFLRLSLIIFRLWRRNFTCCSKLIPPSDSISKAIVLAASAKKLFHSLYEMVPSLGSVSICLKMSNGLHPVSLSASMCSSVKPVSHTT
mmetsp:Transcript_71913/g.168331  ORF Transcript_71913/g.168331 Transcript_71913/m.168331 type:complete len:267 (-) Transcript_71913:1067-1867(-)